MAWWHPDNLKRSEAEFRQQSDIASLDPKNDFGSYRRVLLGDDPGAALVGSHNDVQPQRKVRWLVKALGLPPRAKVLDAGCGLGFTTQALQDQFGDALGVDVSKDAVSWATRQFPKAKFLAQAISPTEPPIGRFELIFCFEFYPFTRNAEVETQAAFIEYFLAQLAPGGKLIIYQLWDNPQSLSAIHEQVKARLHDAKFEIRLVPHPRLPLWLPVWAGLLLSAALSLAGKVGLRRTFTVERATGAG